MQFAIEHFSINWLNAAIIDWLIVLIDNNLPHILSLDFFIIQRIATDW